MSTVFEYNKLSTYVNGIVDRKIKAIAMGITSSTGYLKSLVAQSSTSASLASSAATAAQVSATASDTSASQSLIVYSTFTSTFLGTLNNDPQISGLGNPILPNAFYVNSTNGHLRYTVGRDGANNVVWTDALLSADPQTTIATCMGKFLSLTITTAQSVTGPVTFGDHVTGPGVTDWNSHQLVPASDLTNIVNSLNGVIVTEKNRATAAEAAIVGMIQSEVLRAQNQEGAIVGMIQSEVLRAQNQEGAIYNALDAEHNRAAQAEATTQANVVAEQRRADTAETALGVRIDTEIQRAKAAEDANALAIATEADRAQRTERGFANEFSTGSNANGYWEKRPNGVIEQWGTIAGINGEGTLQITFPIPFTNADSVNVSILGVDSDNADTYDMWPQRVSKDQNGCVLRMQWPAGAGYKFINALDWRAIGSNASGVAFGSLATNGTTTTGGGGGTGGTSGGGGDVDGGGGGTPQYDPYCPEDNTPVLLANEARTNKGIFIRADELQIGDYVWTQHELTFKWGAYKVIQARSFAATMWEADGYYRSTKGHPLYLEGRWTGIDEIGHESGPGMAVGISVEDAHTFVTQDKMGKCVLNHNTKPTDGG